MPSFRENIARALWLRRMVVGSPPWEQLDEEAQWPWLEDADAVLEAMVEPTLEMALAGGCELPNSDDATPTELAEDADKVWRAMIEAAMERKEEPPKGLWPRFEEPRLEFRLDNGSDRNGEDREAG